MKSMRDMPSLKRGKSSVKPPEPQLETEIKESEVNLINKLCASIKSVTASLWKRLRGLYNNKVVQRDQ